MVCIKWSIRIWHDEGKDIDITYVIESIILNLLKGTSVVYRLYGVAINKVLTIN